MSYKQIALQIIPYRSMSVMASDRKVQEYPSSTRILTRHPLLWQGFPDCVTPFHKRVKKLAGR
jgi:hypothetical protein